MIRTLIAAGLFALAITAARAECRDTPRNRAACGGDVARLCLREAYQGMPAVLGCLQAHRRALTPACAVAVNACAARRHQRRKV